MNQANPDPFEALVQSVPKKPKTKLSEKIALGFLVVAGLAMGVGKVYSSMDESARKNSLGLKAGVCVQVATGSGLGHPVERDCGSEAGLWKVIHVYKGGIQNASCEGEVLTTSDFLSGQRGDSYCLLRQ